MTLFKLTADWRDHSAGDVINVTSAHRQRLLVMNKGHDFAKPKRATKKKATSIVPVKSPVDKIIELDKELKADEKPVLNDSI
jgi:hypothetical protein